MWRNTGRSKVAQCFSITGLGILCAVGNDTAGVLRAMKEGRRGIRPVRYLDTEHKELPVGEVQLSDAEMKAMLGIAADATVSRTTLMGAIAIRQAMADAGITAESLEGRRVALLSGTTVGGMDVTERLFTAMKTDDAALQYVRHHDCGSGTKMMAELCGIPKSEVCTISTACSSAANAIMTGCEMLRNDEADIVIAGGSEALSKFHLNGFNTLMILDHEPCRPFDATRAGLNLGEGAAFVVIEGGDAEGRAKAYVGGYGNRCDAFHQTASSEDGEGAFLAMSDALRSARMKPQDIQYVNAHGTGTPNNDPSESAALRRIFGTEMPPVSSTKGMTGHTTSASGSIETVMTILAMQHGFMPQNTGFATPDEACITPLTAIREGRIDHALCNAFGFGGNDSSLLLSREPVEVEKQTGSEVEARTVVEARIAAEVVIDSAEALAQCAGYISPREGRRMNRLMKAATVASLKALEEAGIETPDAIISATAYGMLQTSEQFLEELCEGGEQLLKPTLFMQSTHNTVGSAIAIRTHCHGYNTTYTQGADSIRWAMRDARRLIAEGRAKSVLVVEHDESTPLFRSFARRLGDEEPKELWVRCRVVVK